MTSALSLCLSTQIPGNLKFQPRRQAIKNSKLDTRQFKFQPGHSQFKIPTQTPGNLKFQPRHQAI